MQHLFRATVLIYALGGVICANAAANDDVYLTYRPEKAPSTPVELIKVVKQIADERLFCRDDFYTKEHLLQLFGKSSKVDVTMGDHFLTGSVRGFSEFVEKRSQRPELDGLVIYARKVTPTAGPNAGKPWCDLSLTNWGVTQLDFAAVTGALGPDWKENKDAEFELFRAITREPFNPPFPRPTAYMGNAIIEYNDGEIRLQFGPNGVLEEIRDAAR
jgi:hypothetical protein